MQVTLKIAAALLLVQTVSSAVLETLPFDTADLLHTNLVRGNTEVPCQAYSHTTLQPGDTATFKTPNYPANYGSLNFCKWVFAGSTNDVKITVNCGDFDMAESWSCLLNDNLSLWLGLLNKKWYCGSNGPENVTSNGNWVVAKFHATLFNNAKGFSCTATASGESSDITTAPPTTTPPGPTTAINTTP